MFIYETRNIYASDHTGPFKGIVVSSDKDTPAAVGDTVIFVKGTDDAVLVVDQFTIGSKE